MCCQNGSNNTHATFKRTIRSFLPLTFKGLSDLIFLGVLKDIQFILSQERTTTAVIIIDG